MDLGLEKGLAKEITQDAPAPLGKLRAAVVQYS